MGETLASGDPPMSLKIQRLRFFSRLSHPTCSDPSHYAQHQQEQTNMDILESLASIIRFLQEEQERQEKQYKQEKQEKEKQEQEKQEKEKERRKQERQEQEEEEEQEKEVIRSLEERLRLLREEGEEEKGGELREALQKWQEWREQKKQEQEKQKQEQERQKQEKQEQEKQEQEEQKQKQKQEKQKRQDLMDTLEWLRLLQDGEEEDEQQQTTINLTELAYTIGLLQEEQEKLKEQKGQQTLVYTLAGLRCWQEQEKKKQLQQQEKQKRWQGHQEWQKQRRQPKYQQGHQDERQECQQRQQRYQRQRQRQLQRQLQRKQQQHQDTAHTPRASTQEYGCFSTPPRDLDKPTQLLPRKPDPQRQRCRSGSPTRKVNERLIEMRKIDIARAEVSRSRREVSTSSTKIREQRWCPAPLNSKGVDILATREFSPRVARARVFDWQAEQEDRLLREREQQRGEERHETHRLAPAIIQRKHRRQQHSTTPPQHNTSQESSPRARSLMGSKRGSAVQMDDSQDIEIHRLQEENDSLREYVRQMKAEEEHQSAQQDRRHEQHQHQEQRPTQHTERTERRGSRGATTAHPLHVLESTWIPRKQIEEWRGSLSRIALRSMVAHCALRFLNGEKRYTAGIAVDVAEGEEVNLIVDNGTYEEVVRLHNVSNTCFLQAEVSQDLMEAVAEAPQQGNNNMFAHAGRL